MLSADQEWENFLIDNTLQDSKNDITVYKKFIPKVNTLYISTQTKICRLNQQINLNDVFWKIPVIDYQTAKGGVIKKQMKINCNSREESAVLNEKIKTINMVDVNIIKFVDNPTARKIKYKDVRKINIGIAKKDLTSYRTKPKGAFYNCFVIIMRVPYKNAYKEVHIKVFNTGKLEIPGIQADDFLILALDALVELLSPYCATILQYDKSTIDTVLINSNFACNYYIDRDKLASLLKYKFKMHVNYDPCSYPGIQVKFYYNEIHAVQKGVCMCKNRCSKKGSGNGENQCLEISFMIFRTGSVLIVGHCEVPVLNIIYEFLKTILQDDFEEFRLLGNLELWKDSWDVRPVKKKKVRKKIIIMDVESN